jgi:PAS domain S-box-containing protein
MISVLYIDDEETLLEVGKLFLERSGELQVRVTPSPIDALAMIASTRFDAVVSDYQMPEMDGIGLLKEVRSRNAELPFILFTGKGREEVVIEAINNGADFYLQKGGDQKSQFIELEHKIRQAVERRKVDKALKESESRYRAVFESTGTAMIIVEEDTTISLANSEFLRLTGYSQEDIDSRKSWTEFVVKEDVERMLAQHRLRRERREEAFRQYEFRLITKPGDVRQILLNIDMIPGTKKSIASLIDMTDRSRVEMELKKKTGEISAVSEKLMAIEEKLRANIDELTTSQRALAESQQILYSVLDTIPVRVFWKDTNLNYLGCNRQFAHDSGFSSPQDLIGKSDYEMGWAEQADLYRADDRTVIESGIPKLNYEEPQTTPDGRHIWLRTSKIPLQDAQGTIRGVLGTYEDITAWKEAQIKISTLAQLHAQNPNPIVRVDADGVLRYANPASESMLNLLGVREGGQVPPLWRQWVTDALAQGTISSREQALERSTYSVTLVPFTNDRVVNLYFVDITPRLQAEQENSLKNEELRLAYEQLSAANQVLRDKYQNATLAKEEEELQKRRAERSFQHQKALADLAIADAPKLRDAISHITETGAKALGVERASIWFFSPDGQSLVCNDLYTASLRNHRSGQTISGADYPRYFAALQDNRTIVAVDARTDSHTSEFTAEYLDPLGITSMLDVPIRSGRHVVGVLCFEHTGHARSWEVDEQDFAASLADFTVIVLEKARRRLAEKDLQKSKDRSRITQFAVEHAAEGIVWIDTDGKVVYTNATCSAMLGYIGNELLEMTIFAIDPSISKVEWDAHYAQQKAGSSSTSETQYTKKGGEQLPVEVTSHFFEYAGSGYVCAFVRDISERKRAEKALRLANQKLNLLSSVTRHDILNKLTIVLGYLELSKMAHDREKLEDFINKIDKTIKVIEDQIQFTKDYQDMGVKAPEWQDAASVFAKALSQLNPGTVHVHNDLAGLFVFADPLLERVLYNLLDNALRYGEKVATIRARYQKGADGVILVVEDDGVGIPSKNKAQIFNRGFGKHTGLGLFLAREILSITGMMIMETGFPGTGARFEIHVPPGGYRFADKPT